MRSWMIGVVAAVLPVGLLPVVPGRTTALLILCFALLALWPRRSPWYCLSGIATGMYLALLHGQQLLDTRLEPACSGQTLSLAGHVESLPRRSTMEDGALRQRFEFALTASAPGECGRPERVLLSYYGPELIEPGQQWRFSARVKTPWGLANPGSFNMQSWFAQTGIDAVGSVSGPGAELKGRKRDLKTAVNRLRQDISTAIASLELSGEARAVLRAVTVADKSGINNSLWGLLQGLGINHLLVVSGLHVGLVAGVGFLLGGLATRLLQLGGVRALWIAPLVALSIAAAYCALAGFSVATLRALCMLACFILAHLAGRASASANNLLLAALLVLLINPLAALGSGFWLSFTAVGALLWLARWRGVVALPVRLCSTHVFMSLVMLPLGGWWFGGTSLLAAPANLVMIPLVGLFVVPLALLGALLFVLGLPAASVLWRVAAWPLEQGFPLARELVDAGGHWTYLQYAPAPSSLVLALLGVALWVVPAGWRLRSMAVVLVVPLFIPVNPEFSSDPGATRVAVLDVGQGTAVVVYSSQRALLYDTGGGDPRGQNMARSVVLPFLRHRGITDLDTLVISHGDRDHSAGARSVLEALSARRLRYGGSVSGLASGLSCRAGEAWRWPGGQHFQILSPAREQDLSSNNASCVLRIDVGEHVLLLPGDIESGRERELVRYWGAGLRSQWLHAAHHGSNTSSTHAWLKHVAPEQVIISSGHANRFGHPHPAVIQRLDINGVFPWQTALHGAVEFELIPGQEPVIRTHRQEKRRFWM